MGNRFKDKVLFRLPFQTPGWLEWKTGALEWETANCLEGKTECLEWKTECLEWKTGCLKWKISSIPDTLGVWNGRQVSEMEDSELRLRA